MNGPCMTMASRRTLQSSCKPLRRLPPPVDVIPDRLSAALADRYRIERELGAGGMATVYLAEDLKHHRQVAIKVLKPELAAVLGADRFVQEITTTAQLQHPHILPLFDSGTADGFLFYVMPYVEGETLRDRLSRETQLGVGEAVRITREVADALDYAHRHGVVHRDIKPENILLHDGRPMVADFGIALAVSAAAGGRMTETGLSLGTPHYMSPEQATAEKDLTGRSDVYSLASVLYEMLTGDPPHTGSSAQQIIMKIVTEEAAPVTKLRKSVPPNVAAAVAKALEKLPADRFDSAKAFADALADPGFSAGRGVAAAAAADSPRAGRARTRDPVFLGLGAVALILLIAATWGWFRPVSRDTQQGVFEISVPGSSQHAGLTITGFAAAPDGSSIIYQDWAGQLMLRGRSEAEAKPVAGGVSGWMPFYSPDGRSVAWETGFPGSLATVAVGGSAPRVLVRDSVVAYGGAWGDDGMLYFTSNHGDLMRVSAGGGEPTVVARPDRNGGQLQLVAPSLLPGGKAALVIVISDQPPEVAVVELATGAVRSVAAGSTVAFAPPDYLVVGRDDGTIVAIPFDPRRREVTGPEVVLATDYHRPFQGSTAPLAVTLTGELYYVPEDGGVGTIVRVDRQGRAEPLDPGWHEAPSGLAVSPDGKRLAFSKHTQGRDEIWVKELDRGPLSRLAFGGLISYRPAWSSDGRWIYFVSDRDPALPQSVYRVAATGGGRAQLVYRTDQSIDEVSISRDGAWLLYREGSGGGRDVFAVRVGERNPTVRIATSDAEETTPVLSPDGRLVAYTSDESGRREVYVRPFPDPGTSRWAVSAGGGSEPRWSNSGRELFYRSADNQLMDVRLAPGPGFAIADQRALFSVTDYDSDDKHGLFDVLPDDEHFVFVRHEGRDGPVTIRVLMNWQKALARGDSR